MDHVISQDRDDAKESGDVLILCESEDLVGRLAVKRLSFRHNVAKQRVVLFDPRLL